MSKSKKSAVMLLLLSSLAFNSAAQAQGVPSSQYAGLMGSSFPNASPTFPGVTSLGSLATPGLSLRKPGFNSIGSLPATGSLNGTVPTFSEYLSKQAAMNAALRSKIGWLSSLSSPLLCQARPALSTQQLVQTASRSTVTICVKKAKPDEKTGKLKVVLSQGTGFFVAPGVIATNCHVIRKMIILDDVPQAVALANINGAQEVLKFTKVIASDPEHDVALMAVESKGYGVTALPLADANSMQIGDDTYVYGSPVGLQGTFTMGNISGFRNSEATSKWLSPNDKTGDIVQITNLADHGNSGSAVLNKQGEVVAILWGGPKESGSITFCTNVRYIKGLLISSGICS